jgi:hypothetical protein
MGMKSATLTMMIIRNIGVTGGIPMVTLPPPREGPCL